MTANSDQLPMVAVAGASGFVGGFIRKELSDRYRFRALTRSEAIIEKGDAPEGTEWKKCDLFSLPKLTDALRGCQSAIYLVHSMNPSSRLVQANFADLDLLLADNFVRAAEDAGVEHILYLGGLMPKEGERLSPHLASRREVESVLRSRSVKVSALRAGLIFGPGGSSCAMLLHLVRRLPVMILPAWVSSITHSIDVIDVTRAFREVLADPTLSGGTYDLGGHPPMTYRDLILQAGDCLGRRPRCVSFPGNAFTLSRHWVSWFSGVSPTLVGPLQESLSHDLQARSNPLLQRLETDGMISFKQSIQRATDEKGRPLPNPRSVYSKADKVRMRQARLVRSVQRMPMPVEWDAEVVGKQYGEWLTRRFAGWLKVETDTEGVIRFQWKWPKLLLLQLCPTPYTKESRRRKAYYINGGILSHKQETPGRFEFRSFPEMKVCIASIHGYRPGLPWWIYSMTQAKVHLWVMRAYARYLSRQNP